MQTKPSRFIFGNRDQQPLGVSHLKNTLPRFFLALRPNDIKWHLSKSTVLLTTTTLKGGRRQPLPQWWVLMDTADLSHQAQPGSLLGRS